MEEKAKNVKFISAKKLSTFDLSPFDLIVTDETQRYSPGQFLKILAFTKKRGNRGILAYEKQDIFFNDKKSEGIKRLLKVRGHSYVLSGRIRVNDGISAFVLKMFDKHIFVKKCAYDTINVHFSEKRETTENLLKLYNEKGYTYIVTEKTKEKFPVNYIMSHDAVGREFGSVVVVIDEKYRYNKDGRLSFKGAFPEKLYLAVTRARRKLTIIVENNQGVFGSLLNLKCKK